jgi:STE24 endopeptidase
MKFGRVLLGVAAGAAAGYAITRALEATSAWRSPPPRLLQDSAKYARTRRTASVTEIVRSLAIVAALTRGPLAEALDRATSRTPVWLRPALYAVGASAISAVADLPVSFVEDYELERRYGLSDQSSRAWLVDYAKGTAISLALLAFIATLFGWAVRRAPRAWPLLAAAGTLPLFVLGNVIVPLYVMPLFNSFEPVTGSLEQRLRRLAGRFGVGDADILRMDMSRQTRKANAFVTGIGTTHRIVLGDTLLEAFPEEEIEFIVAHEIGHYASRDTWRLIAAGEALAVALFVVAQFATTKKDRELLRERGLLPARLYATMLPASHALRPLLLAFSRSREWAADRFAIAATGDPQTGAAALRRLRDRNLADEDPPQWHETFFSSHPSLRARIEALERAGTPQSS